MPSYIVAACAVNGIGERAVLVRHTDAVMLCLDTTQRGAATIPMLHERLVLMAAAAKAGIGLQRDKSSITNGEWCSACGNLRIWQRSLESVE